VSLSGGENYITDAKFEVEPLALAHSGQGGYS